MKNRDHKPFIFQRIIFYFPLLLAIIISGCNPIPLPTVEEEILINDEQDTLIFGMLLVGGIDDNGWSEAHYNGALYAEQKVPGTQFIFIDNVNPSGRPGVSTEELANELYAQGAKIIIFNSDDMKDAAIAFAKANPDIQVVHISGDSAWKNGKNYLAVPNLTNAMGQMEYGKMLAGCTAALTSKTGKIAYLGPLENDETRRFASAAYLGAKYCWSEYRNEPSLNLTFAVEWIGYWFNIPGITSDPTMVSESFYEDGYDVIISGIDTTEASQVAQQHLNRGEEVWVIPFEYEGACEGIANVCLGVPYFNWGPFYARFLDSNINETPLTGFNILEPDWDNLNNQETGGVGFRYGPAMDEFTSTFIRVFQQELSAGLNLWAGPIKFMDGTEFLASGEIASDVEIWYLPKLLYGMRIHDSQ